MMRPLLFAVVLLAAFAPDEAQAGRRCYRTYQTLRSNYGWGVQGSSGCYSCHQAGSYHQQKVVQSRSLSDLMAGLAGRQQEYSAMIQGLGALGFTQQNQGYGQQGNAYISGGTMTTAYGGLNNLGTSIWARPQAEVNTMAIMNSIERTASQSGQLYGQVATSLADIGGQQIEVAKINAIRDSAVATLQAARPQTAPSFRTFSFQTQVDSSGNVSVVPQGQQQGNGQGAYQPLAQGAQEQGPGDYGAGSVIQQQGCLTCHNPEKKDDSGGLDLSGFGLLDDKSKAEIAWRCYVAMTNPDESKRMPKGKPAAPPEQVAVFALLNAALNQGLSQTQAQPAATPPAP